MNALAVAHNLLRQLQANVIHLRIEKSSKIPQAALVKARTVRRFTSAATNVGFPASPFAKNQTVSFVLMSLSSSTVMRLKRCATASVQRRLQNFRVGLAASVAMKHNIVARNPPCGKVAGRAPVGRHSRLNHPRAFAGNAADADFFPPSESSIATCFERESLAAIGLPPRVLHFPRQS